MASKNQRTFLFLQVLTCLTGRCRWWTERQDCKSNFRCPMMGFALYDLHVPCTKTTSAFLFLEHDAVSEAQEIQTACINCGRCVSVCPGHVLPARLAKLAERGDMAGFEALDGMECCECGCCSYICPAKRPLTQSIKSMRKMVLASRRKK